MCARVFSRSSAFRIFLGDPLHIFALKKITGATRRGAARRAFRSA